MPSPADLGDALRGGVALGCLLGLIAIGYSLIYGSARQINFAHGEFFVVGGYCSFFLMRGEAQLPGALAIGLLVGSAGIACIPGRGLTWRRVAISVVVAFGVMSGFLLLARLGVPFIWAALLGAVCSSVVAVAAERIVYRPMIGKDRLMVLVAALGLSFVLRGFLELVVGGERRTLAAFGSSELVSLATSRPALVGYTFTRLDIVIAVATVLVTVTLWLAGRYTWLGLAVRAVADDIEVARNLGIDVHRVRVTVFALGGFLAGLACFFFVGRQGFLEPSLGYSQGLLAFCAAVIGGIGRVQGALIGGILIGLVLSVLGVLDLTPLGTALVPKVSPWLPNLDLSNWSLGVVYGVMILVFMFRERGIVAEEEWRAL